MMSPKEQLWHGHLTWACPACPYDNPSQEYVVAHINARHPGEEEPRYSNIELSVDAIHVYDDGTMPKISCIMVTKDRHQMAADSIKMFQKQSYPNRELIIVDDSEPPLAVNLTDDSIQLHYSRCTVGSKRNLACKKATGELIAIWDDDEWQSPNRLYLQWGEFSNNVDLVGIYRPIFGVLATKKMYVFGGQPPSSAWCSGSTLMFRKSIWERNRFLDMNVGEDQAFVQGVDQRRIKQMSFVGFNVAFVHPGNTVLKNVTKAPYVALSAAFPSVE